MSIEVILDASAVLALLLGEAGSDLVRPLVPVGGMSAANHAEVIGKLSDRGYSREALDLASTPEFPVLPLTREIATLAGRLVPVTAHHGLSLGDRCCLATAMHYRVPAVTADQAWSRLQLAGLEVRCIREPIA